MLLPTIYVAAGLLILVVGGEALLRGSVGLARWLRLTPAVIGLTVVAAGTSVPELAVSLVAGFRGENAITVGNVIGSSITNIALILGLGALINPLVITGNVVKLEYPVLILVTWLSLVVCDDGTVNRLEASFLLAVYIAFIAYMVSLVRDQVRASEQAQLEAKTQELDTIRPVSITLFIVIGIALLATGAELTVRGASELGKLMGLSEAVIGLTIVAVGTSLPEIVTTIVATIRGRDDIAVGNIVGSNLFNILVIFGTTGLIKDLPVENSFRDLDLWWMFWITLLLFPVMRTGMRINRLEGLILLGVYFTYMTLLLRR